MVCRMLHGMCHGMCMVGCMICCTCVWYVAFFPAISSQRSTRRMRALARCCPTYSTASSPSASRRSRLGLSKLLHHMRADRASPRSRLLGHGSGINESVNGIRTAFGPCWLLLTIISLNVISIISIFISVGIIITGSIVSIFSSNSSTSINIYFVMGGWEGDPWWLCDERLPRHLDSHRQGHHTASLAAVGLYHWFLIGRYRVSP